MRKLKSNLCEYLSISAMCDRSGDSRERTIKARDQAVNCFNGKMYSGTDNLMVLQYWISCDIIIAELDTAGSHIDNERLDEAKSHIRKLKGVPQFLEAVKVFARFSRKFGLKDIQSYFMQDERYNVLKSGADMCYNLYNYFHYEALHAEMIQHIQDDCVDTAVIGASTSENCSIQYLTDLAVTRSPELVRELDENVDNFLTFASSSTYVFCVPINSLRWHQSEVSRSNVLVIRKPPLSRPSFQESDAGTVDASSQPMYLDLNGRRITCLLTSGNLLFCSAKKGRIMVVDGDTLRVQGELICRDARSLCVSKKYLYAARAKSVDVFDLDLVREKCQEGNRFAAEKVDSIEFEDLVLQVACADAGYLSILVNGESNNGTMELWSVTDEGNHSLGKLYENIAYKQVKVFETVGEEVSADDASEEQLGIRAVKVERKVVTPHKMVFDGNKLFVFGFAKESAFGAKFAFDTWNLTDLKAVDPLPIAAQNKKFHHQIIQHPDHQYQHQMASVIVTKFPGRPFLLFGGDKLRMFNTYSQKTAYKDLPCVYADKDGNKGPGNSGKGDGKLTLNSVVNIWTDDYSLCMVCKDASNKSYLVRL